MRSGRSRGRTVLLTGWLIADLVLAFVLVELASLPVKQASAPVTAASPSTVPSTAAPVAPGMGQPVEFRVAVPPASLRGSSRSAAEATMLAAVRGQLAQRGLTGKQAGFLEVFAAGPESEIHACVQVAGTVLASLRQAEPAMFGNAGGEAYWSGDGNDLLFKIFFYN